jgi:hypothetical protein
MDLTQMAELSVSGIQLVSLSVDGIQIWEKASDKPNLWNLASRTGEKVAWNAASTAFSYDSSKYYYPFGRHGAYNQNGATISDISITEDSLSFKSTATLFGLGIGFYLEAGKSYTLQCEVGATGAIYHQIYGTDNVYKSRVNVAEDTGAGPISYTFTASDTVVVFLFAARGSSSEIEVNFTNISLTECE